MKEMWGRLNKTLKNLKKAGDPFQHIFSTRWSGDREGAKVDQFQGFHRESRSQQRVVLLPHRLPTNLKKSIFLIGCKWPFSPPVLLSSLRNEKEVEVANNCSRNVTSNILSEELGLLRSEVRFICTLECSWDNKQNKIFSFLGPTNTIVGWLTLVLGRRKNSTHGV